MIVRVLLHGDAECVRTLLGPRYCVVTDGEYDVRIAGEGRAIRVGSTVLDKSRLDAEKLDLAVQLALVLDASGDLIYISSADGRLLYANRAWRDALGVPDHVADVVVPEHRAAFRRSLDRALAGERVDVDSVFASTNGGRMVVSGYLTGGARGVS